jgi:hypothetical protein
MMKMREATTRQGGNVQDEFRVVKGIMTTEGIKSDKDERG